MTRAFPEALVTDYQHHTSSVRSLPDPDDIHVVAAAIACDASLIATDNLKDFPNSSLSPFGIEAKRTDSFIADTIDLYPSAAMSTLSTMRKRLNKPTMDAKTLMMLFEARGLVETASTLQQFENQL